MRALDLTLLTDLYELTMMQGYFKNPTDQVVVFDAFYRQNPCDGGYAIAAGLEQVIEYVRDLHFSPDDVEYLRGLNLFDDDFLEYLCDPGRNRCVPERTSLKSSRSCHGSTAGGNCNLKYHQPSESDRHQSLPRGLRRKG